MRTSAIVLALSLSCVALAACAADKIDAATVATGMKAKMKLPMQVDSDTRLDDVRALGPQELGYFLTLTQMTKARADSKPVAEQIEKNVRGGACQNPGYRQLFDAGFTLRMTYRTQDEIELLQIVLTPKDCPKP